MGSLVRANDYNFLNFMEQHEICIRSELMMRINFRFCGSHFEATTQPDGLTDRQTDRHTRALIHGHGRS